ncbi:MAG: T9SS type A sorting domain-containing protein [Flavobacteriales bacterium]
MIKYSLSIFLATVFAIGSTAQFNNVYLNDGTSIGSVIGIKENNLTGEYIVPLGYSLDATNSSIGFLKIGVDGTLNELNQQMDFGPGEYFYIWHRGFFKTQDDGFVLTGGGTGSDIIKLDQNLDIVWEHDLIQGDELFCWGGEELGNNNLIFGYTGNEILPNELKLSRYSQEGMFLNSFNVELDYSIGYPTTIITQDSLVFISFSKLHIGAYRRNYIVCYNAITGEEIWETHQIENGEALGFTDGYMCMTSDGQLKLVYVEQTAPNTPTMFHTGWLGYFKVVNINPQTGEMSDESSLSGLESQSYVLDVAPTNDGGMVVLFWGDDSEQPEYSFCGIKKINANMEVEWRNLYYQPIDLEVNENSSFLIELETTSDDCIVAVGDAVGENIIEEWSFHYPWVLKVDACGNEMVNDCELSNIQERDLNATIQVYPNPAKDRIYLKGNEAIKRAEIFDLQGRKIFEENFSGAQEQTLFIDHIPPGLYLTHITTQSGKTRSVKVVVGE